MWPLGILKALTLIPDIWVCGSNSTHSSMNHRHMHDGRVEGQAGWKDRQGGRTGRVEGQAGWKDRQGGRTGRVEGQAGWKDRQARKTNKQNKFWVKT